MKISYFKHEFIFFMEHVRGTASVHENAGFHMNMIFPYKGETTEYALRKKCPYSELFWSVFPRSRTDKDTLYLSVFSPNAGKYRQE